MAMTERGVPRLFEREQRDRSLTKRLSCVRKNGINLFSLSSEDHKKSSKKGMLECVTEGLHD